MRISWSAHFDLICRGSKSRSIVGSCKTVLADRERTGARSRMSAGWTAARERSTRDQEIRFSYTVRRDHVGFARIRTGSYFLLL